MTVCYDNGYCTTPHAARHADWMVDAAHALDAAGWLALGLVLTGWCFLLLFHGQQLYAGDNYD